MSESEQYTTVLKYLSAISTFDTSAADALVDDDYCHQIRPASLGGFGHPEGFSKDEARKLGELVHNDVSGNTFGEPQHVVHGKDKFAFWIQSNSELTKGGSIKSEAMYIISFTPGTNKICKVVEMLDSLQVSQRRDISPAIAAHLAGV